VQPEDRNQLSYSASLFVFEQMQESGILTEKELKRIKKYLREKYHPLIE